MDSMNYANHFQKVFVKTLVGLLEAILSDGMERDCNALTEKAFCRSITIWCTDEPNEQYDDNLSEKIIRAFGLDDAHTDLIKQAIQEARVLAKKSILDAPYRIVNDFKEAADYMNAFATDVKRQSVMFGVDSGGRMINYAVFKMPFNDKIDFFYGAEYSSGKGYLFPGDDMEYLGFLNKETGIFFDLRGPMELCWFDKPSGVPISESGSEVKTTILSAIKHEVANRVASSIPDLPDAPPPNDVVALFKEVGRNYAAGEANMIFADSVKIPEWWIGTKDFVRYSDEPEVLIAEKADRFMKEHGDSMGKLWIAHLAAQKILSYVVSLGAAVQEDAEADS